MTDENITPEEQAEKKRQSEEWLRAMEKHLNEIFFGKK